MVLYLAMISWTQYQKQRQEKTIGVSDYAKLKNVHALKDTSNSERQSTEQENIYANHGSVKLISTIKNIYKSPTKKTPND